MNKVKVKGGSRMKSNLAYITASNKYSPCTKLKEGKNKSKRPTEWTESEYIKAYMKMLSKTV